MLIQRNLELNSALNQLEQNTSSRQPQHKAHVSLETRSLEPPHVGFLSLGRPGPFLYKTTSDSYSLEYPREREIFQAEAVSGGSIISVRTSL